MNDKKSEKKVGIITFEMFEGRSDIGSSRIRGEWLCKHWKEAELYRQGQEYDVLIFQKAYWVELAREFKGIKIFDLCDPDFLHWGYRTKEMIEEVDVITTSTNALAESLKQITNKPVYCIPDRLNLEEHNERKIHKDRAKSVVWFGYSTGFSMIDTALKVIEELKLNLIVISNQGYILPVNYIKPQVMNGMTDKEVKQVLQEQDRKEHWIELKNYKWTRETVNKDILKGDIVINPQLKTGKWRFKSNNKTLTAWSIGMPVANSYQELEKFLDVEDRKKEAEIRLKEIKEKWDIKISVEELKKIINEIDDKKK
jgi:hydroxymethylpyrimidine pyrophosphatase-like HAD family hydrolase